MEHEEKQCDLFYTKEQMDSSFQAGWSVGFGVGLLFCTLVGILLYLTAPIL